MNSFTLTAIGNVARTPELIEKNGSTFTRFCLVGNDYAGKDVSTGAQYGPPIGVQL